MSDAAVTTPSERRAPFRPDAADAELLALPAPPSRRRVVTVALMALVGATAVLLLVELLPDVRYAWRGADSPRDLGPAASLDPATLPDNAHVRIEGLPMVSKEVHVHRPLGGGRFVIVPLGGQQDVLVQVPVDGVGGDPAARRVWSGRLVRLATLGARYQAVRAHLRNAQGLPVTGETFLLLVGQTPGQLVGQVALAGGCLFVLVLDLMLLLRWFRPIRDPEGE